MPTVKLGFKGWNEFSELVKQIQEDYGPKDSQKILNKAARKAMEPVLRSAQALAPKDTGALAASLRIEARRPNSRDRNSRYVSPSDVMIGLVTTAPGNVLARRSFFNLHNKKTKMKQIGIPSDARANIMEYGSVHIPGGRPYMRVSLRMNQASVTDSLADVLFSTLQKYKSKYNSKGQ